MNISLKCPHAATVNLQTDSMIALSVQTLLRIVTIKTADGVLKTVLRVRHAAHDRSGSSSPTPIVHEITMGALSTHQISVGVLLAQHGLCLYKAAATVLLHQVTAHSRSLHTLAKLFHCLV